MVAILGMNTGRPAVPELLLRDPASGSSHSRLKYVTSLSGPVIQIITGAASASTRKRCSLSRRRSLARTCSVTSKATLSTPQIVPSGARQGCRLALKYLVSGASVPPRARTTRSSRAAAGSPVRYTRSYISKMPWLSSSGMASRNGRPSSGRPGSLFSSRRLM
jgi:hypothetical protein